MKVFYNALSVRTGVSDGAAAFSLNLLPELAAALPHDEVVVLARTGETRVPQAPNLRVERVSLPPYASARVLFELFSLSRRLRKEGADVLVSPNESVPLRPPCPTVVVAQNLAYHYDGWQDAFQGRTRGDRLLTRLQAAYYRRSMPAAYARAARIAAVSRTTLQLLADRARLDPTKARVIYEGSDSRLLPAPNGARPRKSRLLVVSTLAPYKGLERTIELFARLRAGRPDLELDVIGGDWRGFSASLKRHAAALGIGHFVHFMGDLSGEDLAVRYESSLLLLHLSECESFGLPIVEAMRYGLPVVSSGRSSLAEVAGGAALELDGDEEVAARRVLELLDDDGARDELVARGRERAAELTWRNSGERLAEIVRDAAVSAIRAVVLTPYPLSSRFQQELEQEVGTRPQYLNLADLRRRSLPRAIRLLASLRGCRLLLVFESEDSALLKPILEAVAVAVRPSRIEAVRADLVRSHVSRWHAVPAFVSLVRASAEGWLAVKAVARELEELVTEPRNDADWNGGRRVLYLNGNLWVGLKAGGSVGHVAGVVNGLRAAGYGVEMKTVVEPIGVAADVGAELLRAPTPFGLPVETNHYRLQQEMTRQLAATDADGVGFVYQRMSPANYSGVTLSRRLGVPFVLEYNGSEVWVAENWGTRLRYQRAALLAEEACLRHAHLVVTVSDTLRDELIQRGVDPARIVSHPNGVDTAIFDPVRFTPDDIGRLRAGYGIPSDALVVGFIGTFGRWHGAEVLAEAIVRLGRDEQALLEARNVRFIFVGDGLRLPAVREILGRADVDWRVSCPGLVAQAEAPAHLAACDVLVSPHVPNADGSPFFGSPTKLFEYMSMGKAIVASRLGQIGDVLSHGLDAAALPGAPPAPGDPHVAVLCEPGDVEELVAALRFVIDEPEWRQVLGRNSRETVSSAYTWKHHVDAFLKHMHAGDGWRSRA